MRRKNERESRGYDDIVRIRYDRKQPEHDWLKHFRVVRYWVKRNYEQALSINGLFDLSLLPPQPKTTTKLSRKSCNDDRNKRNPSGLCA